ncbi:MAG: hypothetical protein ACREEM_35600 [Blastocatellia bacterium]
MQTANLETIGIKEAARNLVEQLPDNATWDDLMHQIYVRLTIEKGLEDSEHGRTVNAEEVRRQFGLSE